MGRCWRSLALTLLSAAALSIARPSRAEGDAEQPVRVQYQAPGTCPDAVAFFLRVRARTSRVRLANPGELAALVTVHIEDEAGKSRGTLEMPTAEGTPFVRRVDATTCDEVVLALSLVLALAYDPDALLTFPAPPAPAAPGAAAQPPVPTEPPPAEAEPSRFRVGAGADLLFMGGFSPDLQPAPAPFLEVSTEDRGAGGFTPRVRALLVAGLEDEVHVGGRTASLGLLAGRLEGCPWSVQVVDGLRAWPCAAFEVGRLTGKGGSDVASPSEQAEWWLAASLLAALRWEFAASFFAEGEGGMGLPLLKHEFHLDFPFATVHEVPLVYGQFGIGLGAHFP